MTAAPETVLDHGYRAPEERQRIRDEVLGCPDVRGLHDLRTRYSVTRTFVEFHLEVDGDLDNRTRPRHQRRIVETAVEQLFPAVQRGSDCSI